MACKHRHSWILAGGLVEWCYQCGAVRLLRRVDRTISAPATGWNRPTGPDGPNPWGKVKAILGGVT